MIDYDPKDALRLFDAGDYDAELLSCDETTSKAGNLMYVVKLKVYGNNGEYQTLTDYMAYPKMWFKVKRLAQAIGKEKEFEAAKFDPAKHTGASLRVTLKEEKPNVDGLEPRNVISAYLAVDPDKPKFAPDAAVSPDGIPF